MSLDFLRRDLGVINDFFSKKNVKTLNMQETYGFVTDLTITQEEEALQDTLQRSSEAQDIITDKGSEEVKDNIFKNMYIPRSVAELSTEEIY